MISYSHFFIETYSYFVLSDDKQEIATNLIEAYKTLSDPELR